MNTANLTSYSLTESIASTSSWREAPSLSLSLSLSLWRTNFPVA
jgi:hypothetical protein